MQEKKKYELADFDDFLLSTDYKTINMGWIMFKNVMFLKDRSYPELICLMTCVRSSRYGGWWGSYEKNRIICKINNEIQKKKSLMLKTK